MRQDALLTVLWIEPPEQRHFLIRDSGTPLQFRRWLRQLLAALDPSFQALSPTHLQILIAELNGSPIPLPAQEQSGYRYLLTIAVKRRRILLSAWRRHGPAGWRRLWFPLRVKPIRSVSPDAS
jgi:hypothetical protein